MFESALDSSINVGRNISKLKFAEYLSGISSINKEFDYKVDSIKKNASFYEHYRMYLRSVTAIMNTLG